MRHAKNTLKLNRNASHRRCLMANMLKELIDKGQITTTIAKGKALKRDADKMVTLAKANDLAARRRASSKLMLRYNALTPKQARSARSGNTSCYNIDRRVIDILFSNLGPRFAKRQGGYTRLIRTSKCRVGDNSQLCVVEFLPEGE